MDVRGFRPVVSSFTCFSFVLKRPALLALERQSQGMRSFSPPKTRTSVERLFEGETYRRYNEEVTFACRGGRRTPNFQIVKRYVKLCSSSPSSLFFGAITIEEVMATWLLREEVFESLVQEFIRWSWRVCIIDTSTIESRESKGLFLLYLFRFRNTNRSENTRSFCVNRNRNSIPVLVYKPGQSRFTLVYVGLP